MGIRIPCEGGDRDMLYTVRVIAGALPRLGVCSEGCGDYSNAGV